MKSLSFSARKQRGFIDPHWPRRTWRQRLIAWLLYFLAAAGWIGLTILWVIEAGRPYP